MPHQNSDTPKFWPLQSVPSVLRATAHLARQLTGLRIRLEAQAQAQAAMLVKAEKQPRQPGRPRKTKPDAPTAAAGASILE